MSKRLTTEEFVSKAKLVPQHQERNYDYSSVKYINSHTKVEIICPKHGPFWQIPNHHLQGMGCRVCADKLPVTNEVMDLKLIGRNIQRIGDVAGTLNKILWRCTNTGCGNTWERAPREILKGRGCPACKIIGFNPSKPSVIYVYNINDKHCGYGISNNFEQRDNQHQMSFKKSAVTAELIATYECSGTEAERIENLLKNTFEVINTGIKGFKTEATHLHNLPALLELIKNNV